VLPIYRVTTRYVQIPSSDWLAVRRFDKTEFRVLPRYPGRLNIDCPAPVVLYAKRALQIEHVMAVVERVWEEPVGAIGAESLEREGFESIAHFRRYWMSRTKKPFKPFDLVHCFRVRPFVEGDNAMLGARVIERLYGEFLNGNGHR
jgi:hypothetical protein